MRIRLDGKVVVVRGAGHGFGELRPVQESIISNRDLSQKCAEDVRNFLAWR